ncbi:MAG: hypothetical protein U0289_05120 [Cyclobacteriaceae bacterium]|nr:hypothetical protein [Bacteroidia bacterium]
MTFEVKTFVLKTPTIILWLFIAAAMTTMGLFLLTKVAPDNLLLTVLITVPMTLMFPLGLGYILTGKVKFDDDSVTKYSLFAKTELKINRIKTYGIVSSSKSGTRIVKPDNINENDLVEIYFIFLSESDTFDLDSMTRKNHVRLQFRVDVYEIIKEWVKKASAKQCI